MSKAWDGVDEAVIKQSFILCGITAAVVGSEGSSMFSHVPRILADKVTIEEEGRESGEEEGEGEREGERGNDDFIERDDFDPFQYL